jgi:hypothetical protein
VGGYDARGHRVPGHQPRFKHFGNEPRASRRLDNAASEARPPAKWVKSQQRTSQTVLHRSSQTASDARSSAQPGRPSAERGQPALQQHVAPMRFRDFSRPAECGVSSAILTQRRLAFDVVRHLTTRNGSSSAQAHKRSRNSGYCPITTRLFWAGARLSNHKSGVGRALERG